MAQRCACCGRTKAKHNGPDGKYRACVDIQGFKRALAANETVSSEAASTPNPGIVHRTVLVQSAEDEVLYEGSPQIGQELP